LITGGWNQRLIHQSHCLIQFHLIHYLIQFHQNPFHLSQFHQNPIRCFLNQFHQSHCLIHLNHYHQSLIHYHCLNPQIRYHCLNRFHLFHLIRCRQDLNCYLLIRFRYLNYLSHSPSCRNLTHHFLCRFLILHFPNHQTDSLTRTIDSFRIF
jgi:hypothetical protein